MGTFWKRSEKGRREILDHISDFRLRLAGKQYPANHKKKWWSLLLCLNGISINDFEGRLTASHRCDIFIPNDYEHCDREYVSADYTDTYVSVFARPPLIHQLNRKENPFSVGAITLGMIIRDEPFKDDEGPTVLSDIRVPKDTVVTAVIDDGIAIGHNLLRDGTIRSRVLHTSILPSPPGQAPSTKDHSLSKADIDKYLQECTFNDLLNDTNADNSEPISPVSPADGRYAVGVLDEFVPCLAAEGDDVIVRFEHTV